MNSEEGEKSLIPEKKYDTLTLKHFLLQLYKHLERFKNLEKVQSSFSNHFVLKLFNISHFSLPS
jgi:hypothetical protein